MSTNKPWKQNKVANYFSYFNDLKKFFYRYRSTGKSSKNIPVLCIAMRAFYGFILALPIRQAQSTGMFLDDSSVPRYKQNILIMQLKYGKQFAMTIWFRGLIVDILAIIFIIIINIAIHIIILIIIIIFLRPRDLSPVSDPDLQCSRYWHTR